MCCAPVAQLDRALASGARGHRFESCRAYQLSERPAMLIDGGFFFIASTNHELRLFSLRFKCTGLSCLVENNGQHIEGIDADIGMQTGLMLVRWRRIIDGCGQTRIY